MEQPTENSGNPCGSTAMTGYNAARTEVIGDCTLYQGDCAVILPQLPDFDLILTDPPYGINAAAGIGKFGVAKFKDCTGDTWDNTTPPQWLLGLVLTKGTNQIIFGGNYFNLPPSSCWLVWDKDNGKSDFADCELVWTSFSSAVRKIRYRWQGMLQENMKYKDYRQHPTQKPVAVMRWIIENYSSKDSTILDPFMGSGTTLVAAKQLGREAVGIEISEKYCEIARKKLAEAQVAII